MIFGAEGWIGIVNIFLLLGALAFIILLVSAIKYMRFADYKKNIHQHALRYSLIGLLLLLIAMPTVAFSLWAGWDYVSKKSYRDTFERNNQLASTLYASLYKDDLAGFKNALSACGSYCIHSNPGYKKYDELIISAKQAQASNIEAYLEKLNQAEIALPQLSLDPSNSVQWAEIEVSE